jgi:hypothetical protein
LILPHGDNLNEGKMPAAQFTINGFGKVAEREQVRQLGIRVTRCLTMRLLPCSTPLARRASTD